MWGSFGAYSLPALVGSDRQTAWVTTIRAKRLATMPGAPDGAFDGNACLSVSAAKWWIDHRDLSDAELIQKAEAVFGEAA
jgi:hypothetical protein